MTNDAWVGDICHNALRYGLLAILCGHIYHLGDVPLDNAAAAELGVVVDCVTALRRNTVGYGEDNEVTVGCVDDVTRYALRLDLLAARECREANNYCQYCEF